ncbi:MAG: single-stranded DNA-binding protein [Oscillospiraceae bacterium]|jgi:single-strand DNA-binding protein|nr:single-stranded DNA-binding protein [Oscillospiraceae bacterium]
MNQVVLMGRLTRDPELRHTQTGTPVASFTLAVDRGFAPRDGGDRQTDFIDIVTWRQTAEFVSKYFVKGQLAAVTGRLQIRDWTDKEGNKRRNAEIIAENVYFTGDKRERGDGSARPPYQESGKADDYSGGYSSPVQPSGFAELDDEDDGDLPF